LRLHTAIIMDGNGRWANRRGLPRAEGHRRGAVAVREAIEASPALGITDLTLYAFSSDNWKRPAGEISCLMHLFAEYLRREVESCRSNGVRLTVIGRRDRLPETLQQQIREAESWTRQSERLHVRIAVDYSSRDALLRAAETCAGRRRWTREDFAAALPAPDVDLLIRTSGEQRLSDFLLWESAYAEFVFLEKAWPDFTRQDLAAAVAEFQRRSRRFGTVPAA
jgi:undecaprenyl diphosphate synthase